MRQERTFGTRMLVLLVGLVVGLALFGAAPSAEALDDKPGSWSIGAGGGFLSGTPDGAAFAVDFYADVFVLPNFSVGPLLQLGFTGPLKQVGVSGQAKYWIDIPGTANRLKLAVQGGLGFVHADFRDDDTSWLIVLGVGADYALSNKLSVTGTFLLNLTDLDTGRGTGADVMPGLTFGVRF